MATIRRVGDTCDPTRLPKFCGCVAWEDDTLIVIMDGGVYLWGVFDDRFADIAVGQLDCYHASQHLHALADALFPKESQCSQNQNRFKRRGQFWSKGGFASFLEAYVWYTNDEIKYLYRRAS